MDRKVFLSVFLFSSLVCGVSSAQTFAPGSVQRNNSQVQQRGERIRADNPLRQENDDEQTDTSDNAGDYEILSSAQKNFRAKSEKEDEKKYDNTVGKLIEFRIENGEVIFEDDANRKILVYYDDYKIEKGMDGLVRCSFRLYVLNDLTEKLSNLSFKLKWPKISTNIQMVHVNPGVRTYVDTMLLGDGCYTMDKTPVIEVNRCRVKGRSEDECADAVRWFNSK